MDGNANFLDFTLSPYAGNPERALNGPPEHKIGTFQESIYTKECLLGI